MLLLHRTWRRSPKAYIELPGGAIDLLAQVRQRSLAAFEHQDVPFEVLVDRLNPTRSLTHHPLVQVMLAWQNFTGQADGSAAESALGDVRVSPLPADTHSARMDLVFALGERFGEAGEPAGIVAAFLELLFRECERERTTLIFVTHDATLAPLFDRAVEFADLNRIAGASPDTALGMDD